MKQVWRTADGQVFDELDRAKEHESADFEQWFKNQAHIVEISKTLNDDREDEIYGTQRRIFKSIICDYYWSGRKRASRSMSTRNDK
jgi:hypothetical protein